MPMIHSARLFKSLNSPFVNERPPRCLRYIMCALAASTDSNNARESKAFYKQAKECLDDDKAKEEYDRGSINTLSHVQTIVLIAIYEHRHRFRSGPNMRLSEALALSNNLGLHKGPGPNFVEYGIANHSDDFGEVEERRRTFWVCFIEFVYTSCDEESLSPIREDDVTSHLPVSDEDFENGEQVETMPLQYALTVQGAEKLTPFAGACAMTCLLRRIMTHNAKGKRGHDPWNVSFKRYNELFQTLQAVKAGLPDEFKLCGSFDPRNLFVGVLFHAARIELHWVAMEKADGRDDRKAVHNHKLECVTAAADMSKMFTHSDQMDMSQFHPFTFNCLRLAHDALCKFPHGNLHRDNLDKVKQAFKKGSSQERRPDHPSMMGSARGSSLMSGHANQMRTSSSINQQCLPMMATLACILRHIVQGNGILKQYPFDPHNGPVNSSASRALFHP
ncbi:hypothetical protein HDK77DRAFT_177825 [Phyllosticta capitalensis]